jgi:hypothetical protein
MNKILLFLILVLPVYLFAQNKFPDNKDLDFNSIENFKYSKTVQESQNNTENKLKNLEQNFKLQSQKQDWLVQINDSIYHWKWDKISKEWVLNYKEISLLYNTKFKIVYNITQEWDGARWVNKNQNSYTFNDLNQETSHLIQKWDGNNWENQFLFSNNYDSNNNLINSFFQHWNSFSWGYPVKQTYTYDENNNETTHTQQVWKNNEWMTEFIETHTYDSNNNLTSEREQWFGDSPIDIKNIYFYDSNNNLSSGFSQTWNGTEWENDYQYIFKYTWDKNNNKTSEIVQCWKDNELTCGTKRTYTYDLNNNLINYLNQGWDGSEWVNSMQFYYTYDSFNNNTSEIYQIWRLNYWFTNHKRFYSYDSNNFKKTYSIKSWQYDDTVSGGDSISYYFHTEITGKNDLDEPSSNIEVYPNPSNGAFSITSQTPINSIEIFNLQGVRIYSRRKFNHQTTNGVGLSGQFKGIFIMKINSGDKIQTKKIMVY